MVLINLSSVQRIAIVTVALVEAKTNKINITIIILHKIYIILPTRDRSI